jgi:hypothetical protein
MEANPMKKIPIGERALLQRVNRALADQSRKVFRCKKNSATYAQLGDFYQVDSNRKQAVETHIDLVAIAKKLGCLKPWESLLVVAFILLLAVATFGQNSTLTHSEDGSGGTVTTYHSDSGRTITSTCHQVGANYSCVDRETVQSSVGAVTKTPQCVRLCGLLQKHSAKKDAKPAYDPDAVFKCINGVAASCDVARAQGEQEKLEKAIQANQAYQASKQ